MSIRQLSVFLENRPGKLYDLTALLAAYGIDMRALSIAEATDFGIARIIVNDVDRCALALREGQFIAQLSDVLAFAVPDEPGGLHNLLSEFNAAQVNIEYMYAFRPFPFSSPSTASVTPFSASVTPSASLPAAATLTGAKITAAIKAAIIKKDTYFISNLFI